ncbi:phage minor capsid protein [Bacillus sp. FSL K6-3431]|uniref:phage minor capsid protein n=1 Tax=Bacillus sp. FSL K6-3431 TaxID=2921500 RepID=UPI0030F6E573
MSDITPHQLNLYTAQVTDIYVALEDEIFLMVARRLKTNPAHGKDYVLQWQIDKMQQLRMLNTDTIKALSKATGLSTKAIRKAVKDVGFDTISGVDEELKEAFKKLEQPTQIDAVLESFVKQAFREVDNFVNQTLITTNYGEGKVTQMYRKIIEETTSKVLAGTKTINQATAETVIKWSNRGIETAFIDKGGHVWGMERYVDTVIRSTVNNTYNELRLSRMDEYGVDLVLVNSYPDAREACSAIQGKVASMSNPSGHPDYPSIYDFGYGTPSGIRGINCRHILYPFVEGLNTNNQTQYDPQEAYERGKVVQKQRHYERQIRESKRSLKLAEEIGDEDTIQKYKRQVSARQARMREFIKENDLPRRYDKERVIK